MSEDDRQAVPLSEETYGYITLAGPVRGAISVFELAGKISEPLQY